MIKKKSSIRKTWINPEIKIEKVRINFFFSRRSRSSYSEDFQGMLLAGLTCDYCVEVGSCGGTCN